MNIKILNREVQEFIKDNLTIDIPTFLLKKPVFEGISQQELAQQILSKKKCEKKLPTWFETPRIYYPPTLSIEQTSSGINGALQSYLSARITYRHYRRIRCRPATIFLKYVTQ